MRRALALALAALVAFAATVLLTRPGTGVTPRPIIPVPQSEFTPFAVATSAAPSAPTRAPSVAPTPVATPSPTELLVMPHPPREAHLPPASSVTGIATWYCNYTHPGVVWSPCMAAHPDRPKVLDLYAAAGPALRVALGGNAGSGCPCPWRGKVVTVTGSNGRSVAVILADWCACGGDHVIDLYFDAFAKLAPGQPVTVTW